MADKTTELKVVFKTEGLQNLRGLSSGLSKLNKGAKGAGISVKGLLRELKAKERTEVKSINNTSDLNKDSRPLDKGLWDGAVDTVGGQVLANVLAQTKEAGIVAACGNAADIKLNTTVMPFII